MTTKPRAPWPRPSREAVTTALDLVGLVLICGGIAAIFWPAALMTAGAGLIVASWRATR